MKRGFDTFAALALFLVFAAGVLTVLVYGARIYRAQSADMQTSFSRRTCLSYISAKVRHFDEAGALNLEDFDGVQALTLREVIADTPCVTYIYCYDGQLMELFCEEGTVLSPRDGLEIAPIAALSFAQEAPGLFYIVATAPDGGQSAIYLAVRSQSGVGS